jgi:hypothetical protein
MKPLDEYQRVDDTVVAAVCGAAAACGVAAVRMVNGHCLSAAASETICFTV